MKGSIPKIAYFDLDLKSIASPKQTTKKAPNASGVESLAKKGNPVPNEIMTETNIGLLTPNLSATLEILKKSNPEKKELIR